MMGREMLRLEAGSRAQVALLAAVQAADYEAASLTLWFDEGDLKVKVGEGTWSPPLITGRPDRT